MSLARRAAPLLLLMLWGLGASTPSWGHEVRPAFLELSEREPGIFDVLFKHPLRGELRLRISPVLPEHCQVISVPTAVASAGVLVERWSVDCGEQGLLGYRVGVAGLETTLVDTLLQVHPLARDTVDGAERADSTLTFLLRPEASSTLVSSKAAGSVPVAAYLRLGVDHLLFGFDHILFVIGLMFFVERRLELLQVITAFTVAHSITLALSALGVVRLSQAPVEAIIALSILYLAVELLRGDDRRTEVTRRFPWTIAFGFGLLHGFGFAGALAEIGLPQNAVAGALFLFNVGVELGQLMIVGAVLIGLLMLRSLRVEVPKWLEALPIYFIGTVSAYWFIERIVGMI